MSSVFSDVYMVVGPAKTGTTVVARTLQRTLRISNFCMEPSATTEIERAVRRGRVVVKIIFDTWQPRLEDLTRVCRQPSETITPAVLFAVRDPRDELISRLHYCAYDFFSTRPTTPHERRAWIDVFRRKEQSPDRVGMLDMEAELLSQFGKRFRPGPDFHHCYAEFVERMITALDANARVVRYEEFVGRTIADAQLQSILAGAQDVHPLERRVRRSAASGAWNTFFTDRDATFFQEYFRGFLLRFGYPLARSQSSAVAPADAGSAYVARLIEEACAVLERNVRDKPASNET
jgi:hypothetical protein